MPATKDARLNLRLTAEDEKLIRQAAKSVGRSVTEFLSEAGIERAHAVLADQHHFELDEDAWDEFVSILDRPVRPDARLVDLFSRPQSIER